MTNRTLGYVAVGLGLVLVLLGVLADELGMGGQPGFGWKQAVMLAVGVIAIGAGAALAMGRLVLIGPPPADPEGKPEARG